MSHKKRESLVEKILDDDSRMLGIGKTVNSGSSMMEGSWDLTSLCFQNGFESLWDLTLADRRGLLELPLLSLWWQSIELALKSAIFEVSDGLDQMPGHNLLKLFEILTQHSAEKGICTKDDLTLNVRGMIEYAQEIDPNADRFRYPSNKNGVPFMGLDVDLDKLFKAHWIIVTYCEGTVVELREKFGIGSP